LNTGQVYLFPGMNDLYVIAFEEAFLHSLVGGGKKKMMFAFEKAICT